MKYKKQCSLNKRREDIGDEGFLTNSKSYIE
jgi:hypothetical protein